MSDAAWGLSFGKFLELSFSNHATANRVASCGHSLQKDCLRYYGYIYLFRFSLLLLYFGICCMHSDTGFCENILVSENLPVSYCMASCV